MINYTTYLFSQVHDLTVGKLRQTGLRKVYLVGLDDSQPSRMRDRVWDVAPKGRVRGRIVLEKHSTKSKKSRTVAVSKQAVRWLQKYLNDRGPGLDTSEPLFPSQRWPNQAMSETNAILALKRMFQVAGVENASSHSLRRTHANALRRNGVDLKVIQNQLGHSSLAVTERYFQVDPLEHQRAIEQLRF
jgi:integrase/recombinase XerD